MLEETLKQSAVSLNFIDIEKAHAAPPIPQLAKGESSKLYTKFHYSTLRPIRVDEAGRVANWPTGFLDDDVKESQRLLDIMYGHRQAGGDDDDERL